MKPRILFAGDSITRGDLGRSYIDLLADSFPNYKLVNLGPDGDTVSGISKRIMAYLVRDAEVDLIVIAAGHNDIILPEFLRNSMIHRAIDGIHLNPRGAEYRRHVLFLHLRG